MCARDNHTEECIAKRVYRGVTCAVVLQLSREAKLLKRLKSQNLYTSDKRFVAKHYRT